MLRVTLIPRGVNHGEDKPSCIQSGRYPIRGRPAEKQRLAQALFWDWRYSRTIYIILGMWEWCLLNHVYIHSFQSIIKATEKFPGGGGIWSPGMDLWWGIWTAFRPREGGIWTKVFQKFKCLGGCPGEGGDAQQAKEDSLEKCEDGGNRVYLWFVNGPIFFSCEVWSGLFFSSELWLH